MSIYFVPIVTSLVTSCSLQLVSSLLIPSLYLVDIDTGILPPFIENNIFIIPLQLARY